MRSTRGTRSTRSTKLVLAAMAAASLSLAACQTDDAGDQPAAATVATIDTSHIHVDSAAGEVAHDSAVAPVTGRWITDANVLSLLSIMSSRQIAAADAELQAWRSDTVRAFAASVAREHAELQHSVDSLSERMHVAPIAPALADPITAAMQAQIDSMKQPHAGSLDRAFVREQVASEGMMADYVQQMMGVAERPEVQALLASASTRVGAQIGRARTLQASITAGDSTSSAAAADSAARRAARRKR
jgi:predicted outer membrane protein